MMDPDSGMFYDNEHSNFELPPQLRSTNVLPFSNRNTSYDALSKNTTGAPPSSHLWTEARMAGRGGKRLIWRML